MSSSSRLDRAPRGIFTREDFERAWAGGPPISPRTTPGTAIVICRNSPDDFSSAPLEVMIDQERLGEIACGQVLTRSVEPGRHVVCVFGGWSAQTLAIDAHSNERVRLRCGRGQPASRWVRRFLPFVARLGVWLTRE